MFSGIRKYLRMTEEFQRDKQHTIHILKKPNLKIMCLAIPGKVIEITNGEDSLLRSGKISFGGAVKSINLSFIPEANEGDYVLVHAGFALSVIDEEEAQRTLDLLKQMGDIE